MEKKKKITLIIVLVCFLFLLGYLIYPDTVSASLKDSWGEFNIISPDEIGKTVEENGVVVTVKLPRTVKLNENITVNYTITNKRQETIYPNTYNSINHTQHTGMTPLYFKPVHPGETITFTDSYPIRNAYDGVERDETSTYSNNTATRVFNSFYVWIINLDFDHDNDDPIVAGYELGRITYKSVWSFSMDLTKGTGITSII
jgi:hypothetical protein